MNIRKTTTITISIVFLIVGFVLFRFYYIELITKLSNLFFKEDIYIVNAMEKLIPNIYFSKFFPALFYFSVIIILITRTMDVIFNDKKGLGVLSSFKSPIFLTCIITCCLFIRMLNILQLWTIFYVLLLICLHSTFKILVLQTESIGSSANLKLIKGFFISIKDTIKYMYSTGIKNLRNPIDEVTTILFSGIVLLLEVITLISFIIYIKIHWRLIFLSFLLAEGSL